MKLDITPILRNSGGTIGFSYDEPLEMLEGGIGTIEFQGLVHIEGQIKNFNGMLELEAKAETMYETQCDRCCKPLQGKISVVIDEDVVEASTSENSDVQVEERYEFTGHELQLDTIAAEAILLDIPIIHLCSEDCKGLCPDCGIDLNLNSCHCSETKQVDSRLELLRKFSASDEED